tara:strand:- start:233 stop:463 length:231 start_codon:yes stop_codon:yes gene_type:complete
MDRNTRHSVDKSKEFINSGMTLITDPESDKHLKLIKAKIEANSPYNDGWTKQFYQEIVDEYEHQDSEDRNQRQQSS